MCFDRKDIILGKPRFPLRPPPFPSFSNGEPKFGSTFFKGGKGGSKYA